MRQTLIIGLYLLMASSCGTKRSEEVASQRFNLISSPAGEKSAEPWLFTDKNGIVYMSWIEHKDSLSQFKFSTWTADAWSSPFVIASGNSWFENWADYPMVVTDGEENFMAHLLDKSGEGTYAYDVKIFTSSDGGQNWHLPYTLHDDKKQAEHGFVAIVPHDDKFFVSWLDGRNTVMEGSEGTEHEGHHGAMSLRAAIIDPSGKKEVEWELDDKTCDCCQTTAAITENGPVVIYRDRSADEIRDMAIVRLVNGSWTAPVPLYRDNWKITGCPVNGPRVDAIGNVLAVAWFSAPAEKPMVNIIFSGDGGATFDLPIRVDQGDPIGRVDVVLMDEQTAMVSWMEGAEIMAVKVNRHGTVGNPIAIQNSSEARSSGFPQMTRMNDQLMFAWTDEKSKRVKVGTLSPEL